MTDVAEATTLQLTHTFPASRDRVFRAWTRPDDLKQWFRAQPEFSVAIAEVDLQVGGRYRLGMKPPEGDPYVAVGTYVEIDAPQKLVFTWRWEGDENPETLVTVEFLDRGETTDIVLTHQRFPDQAARDQHRSGWTGCLENLGAFLDQID